MTFSDFLSIGVSDLPFTAKANRAVLRAAKSSFASAGGIQRSKFFSLTTVSSEIAPQPDGIGADLYFAVTPLFQYGAEELDSVISFLPPGRPRVLAQVAVSGEEGLQPFIEETVDFLSALTSNPLDFLALTTDYITGIKSLGATWIAQEQPSRDFSFIRSKKAGKAFGSLLDQWRESGGSPVGGYDLPKSFVDKVEAAIDFLPPEVTAPNDDPYVTVDVAQQYDPIADFPVYPLNALSLINSISGVAYLGLDAVVNSDVSRDTVKHSYT